jgi:[NiFe] hydrogenase assembly HybE family chaperone
VTPAVADRVAALQARYEHIAASRMAGLPILHPGLQVRALGFEPAPGGAWGVLLTPWFMNLVWLPAAGSPDPLAPRATRSRTLGGRRFEMLGADEPGFGPYEACSLFSPMHAFADQAAAEATAQAVLAELRRPPEVQAARRALLFGRAPAPPAERRARGSAG